MNSCGGKLGGVGGSGMSGASNAVSTQAPLQYSLDNLGSQLSFVEENLEHLFNRLKPIRNEKPLPSNPENVGKPIAPKSGVVNSIDSFSMRLSAIKGALEIVISELEV